MQAMLVVDPELMDRLWLGWEKPHPLKAKGAAPGLGERTLLGRISIRGRGCSVCFWSGDGQ